MEDTTDGTLAIGEYHPAADSAMAYIRKFVVDDYIKFSRVQESFASATLSGNRLAEICVETLLRIVNGEGVSDRYLLGLAWTLKSMESKEDQ